MSSRIRAKTKTAAAAIRGFSFFCIVHISITACSETSDSSAGGELAEAISYERGNALVLDAFFNVDESPRQFGELIRSSLAEGYDIPAGIEATRILYRSRDHAGKPTTASAVVLVPEGAAPEGGWPLVVWAHGTTGVARQCGPSATKSLGYYSIELINELMQRDIALLVVDYAGLSTAGAPHQYMAKTTNALDIESAVPAAQAAVNSLSSQWLAIGHSQGGAAVWGLAEQKALRPDPGYLGSIALAPAVGGADLINNNANLERETFYPVYWAHAVKAQSPEFAIETMLTEEAVSLYEDLTLNGCWDYGFALSASLAPGTVLRAGWEGIPTVEQFLASIRSGEQPISGPLFVAAGREDIGVREEFIENAVQAQCETGADVLYRVYPGSHDGMMETSFDDQMKWIEARFAGVATENGNCG
ncbi:MAG: hypothetical protein AAGF57_15145 [Pseudomonadota bacterium]